MCLSSINKRGILLQKNQSLFATTGSDRITGKVVPIITVVSTKDMS